MTLPDAIRKSRNLLAVVGALAVALSAGCALAANWWLTPFDYWLVFAAWATGLGGGAAIAVAVIMQIDLYHTLQLNRRRWAHDDSAP